MVSLKKQKDSDFKIEIGLQDGKRWNDEKLAKVNAIVKSISEKRTPERKLKNEMLTIKFLIKEYLDNESLNEKDLISLESFLNMYLKVLSITLKKFATLIDTTDSNLKKYLSGERKFNTDLALKFGHFFHTTPDLWLKVNIKNELIQFKKEKKQSGKYRKYDYESLV